MATSAAPARPGWRPAALAGTAAAVAIGVAAAGSGPGTPLPWMEAAAAAVGFALLGVTAATGIADGWIRADRRSLALGGACSATGVLWLVTVPALSRPGVIGTEGGQALSLLAALGGAGLLLYASAVRERPRVQWPRVAVPLTVVGSVAAPLVLAGVVYLSAPSLPALTTGGGLTVATRVIGAAPAIPLAIALWLHLTGRSRDSFGGGLRIGLVLLLGQAVASVLVTARFSPGWYGLIGLRTAAFAALAAGAMARYARTAAAERRQADGLAVLAETVRLISAAPDPNATAAAIADAVGRLVAGRFGPKPIVTVYHVDGPSISPIRGFPVSAAGASLPAPSLPVDRQLLREAVDSGELTMRAAEGRAAVPIRWREAVIGLVEIAWSHRSFPDPATFELLATLVDVGGMGLAHADVLSDLETVEEQNRAILGAVTEAYISLTPEGVVVGWNGYATDLFGWQPQHVVGRGLVDLLVAPEDRDRCRAELARDSFTFELSALHRCGTPVRVAVNGWRQELGGTARIGLLLTDISARHTAESRLSRRETHDPLTELPNRSLTLEYLTRALHTGNHGGERVAVMSIDLDGFAALNQVWGPEAGDRVLATVAYRLLSVVRPGDAVGRVGADEFLIVNRGVRDPAEAHMVAARINRVLSDPIELIEGDVTVSASIGVAFSDPDSTARDLLQQSRIARHQARRAPDGALTRTAV